MEPGDSKEHFQNRYKLKLSSSEDCKSDTGTLESVNDAVDGTQEDSNKGEESNNLPANMDDAVFFNENRTFFDVSVYNAPKFEGDKQQIVENTELPESPLVNTRALPKEATTYRLETFKKHALLIINQNFLKYPAMTRFGTEKDVKVLTSSFENFGFEVTLFNDLTKQAIFVKLKEFSKRDFTDYGCVAVAILTHGRDGGKLQAEDLLFYKENDVIDQFMVVNNATLVSKPKIFIIQACRGKQASTAVPVELSSQACMDHADLKKFTYNLPMESDFLIFHSSYQGRTSFRVPKTGSWFIQTLCDKIDTLSLTEDLDSIITEVKRAVAIDMEFEKNMNVNKQMPIMTSTLIRKLQLRKFEERAVQETERCSEPMHKVLRDVGSRSSPMTPMVSQVGPCSYLLEHFTFMTNCLRYFVAENPNDETAQYIVAVADTLKDTGDFNSPKKHLCKLMSKHILDIIT